MAQTPQPVQPVGRRRGRMSPADVAMYRRGQVVAGTAEVAHEFGIREVSVGSLCRLAGMSRGTFYNLFGGRSGCLRYGFAESFARLFKPTRMAIASNAPWATRLEIAISGLFSQAAKDPALAELCLVHSFGAAEEARGHDLDAGVALLEELFRRRTEDSGRPSSDNCGPPAEECLARTILSLVSLQVMRGEGASLMDHLGPTLVLANETLLSPREPSRTDRRSRSPAWHGVNLDANPIRAVLGY